MTDLKRITDIPGGIAVVQVTHQVQDLVGKEVVITRVEAREGQFGSMMVVSGAFPDGEEFTFITGATVLVRQLAAAVPYLPVIARIERVVGKRGRAYYVLT